jgi:hypothetical protein
MNGFRERESNRSKEKGGGAPGKGMNIPMVRITTTNILIRSSHVFAAVWIVLQGLLQDVLAPRRPVIALQ